MVDHHIKASLTETYDKYAHTRDNDAVDWWKKQERARFLAQLKAEGKQSLLEIGAGTGRESLFFKENGLINVGFNIDEIEGELEGIDELSKLLFATIAG